MTMPTTPVLSGKPAVTLEQAGILPGSRFLATPEQQAEIDRLDRERIQAGIAVIDAALAGVQAAQDDAAEDRAAAWLDWAEEARRRRDQRLAGKVVT